MITLSSLRPNQERHHPKRVGRGDSSGKGTTAGRGTKGQRARTGGRNKLIRRGLKHLIERTPKTSGQPSQRSKLEIVSLMALEQSFADGQKIGPVDMKKAGLVAHVWPGVKILGAGPVKKKLHVTSHKFSAAAAAALTKAGGTIFIIPPPPPQAKKSDK